MKFAKILIKTLAPVGCLLLLASCGGPGFEAISAKAAYKEVHKAGAAALETSSELARVDLLLKTASKEALSNPDGAIGYYLEAVELAGAVARRGGEHVHVAQAYHRHGVGQAAQLIHRQGAWNNGASFEGEGRRYTVSVGGRGRAVADPAGFDNLIYADRVNLDKVDQPVVQDGVGSPMVAARNWSQEREEENPFMHEIGIVTPLTAVVDFPSKGRARFVFYRPRVADRVVVAGKRRQLAANFSAPLVLVESKQVRRGLGIRGALRPASFADHMALFSTEEPDPQKIPLVLVHGLASRPATWKAPYMSFMEEREIREKYQVYFFYYPTGLPPMYPAAGFRRELIGLHGHLKKNGAGSNADRMVLIGHSMGGLMVSGQVRDFRGVWEELFTKPIEEVGLGQTSRRAVSDLFETAPPRFVTRAVFVAVPHRGSTMANNWLGRLGSQLARVPERFLSFQFPQAISAMTDVGRSVLLTASPPDGMYRLRYGNPALELAEKRPISPWVTYHSIIGDEGKGDTPDSSDGTVSYASSHLDGAASELIVPSGHSAQRHPEGIAEMKRILRLHLRGR